MSDLPWIDDGSGHRRVMGCLEPEKLYAYDRFASDMVIPQSEWQEVDLSYLWPGLWDQDGHGSCVGHGSAAAFLYAWLMSGATFREFSPTWLYSLINGNSDNGAIVGDALEAMQKTGMALMEEVGETLIYQRQMPSQAKETARRFKIQDAVNTPTWEEVMSAVQRRRAVSFGCSLGNNFDTNSQGIVPPRRGSVGGHCMCVVGAKTFDSRSVSTFASNGDASLVGSAQVGGVWYAKVKNSWGTRWGMSGYCYMPSSYFGDVRDAFAPTVHPEDPQEPIMPPDPH
jgi:hypothetical protein